MRLLKASMVALKNLDSGVVSSVHELPANVRWDLWENGLVKDDNTITKRGQVVLELQERSTVE